jgi:hypothetical protein
MVLGSLSMKRVMDESEGYQASEEGDDKASLSSLSSVAPQDCHDVAIPAAAWEGDQESNGESLPAKPSRIRDKRPVVAAAGRSNRRPLQNRYTKSLSGDSSRFLTDKTRGSQSRDNKNGTASENEQERRGVLADLISASAPRLRHLADNSSIDSYSTKHYPARNLHTPVSEQRHPGKEGARLSRHTRDFDPVIEEEDDTPSPPPAAPCQSETNQRDGYLHGFALQSLVLGLCLVVSLISVDRTIITTVSTSRSVVSHELGSKSRQAIPYITEEFRSTADIGWYGSSYLLTACAFQPVYGRIYTLYDSKWSYLSAMFLFEVGSLICALSPTSPVLIIGRAIAGFGSAGILTGSFVIVATAVPLQLRPIYTAGVGLM